MEELLAKISELERKVSGLISHYQSKAEDDSEAREELARLQDTVDQLQEENEQLKNTLSQVRSRVSDLLEKVCSMAPELGNSEDINLF